jgi:hypothetical protein
MPQAFSISSGEHTLTAANTEVVLRVNAATDRPIDLDRIRVSFNGVSPTAEPPKIDLVRLSDNGTMTAVTPKKLNDSKAEALEVTGAKPDSVEPTVTDYLAQLFVHPQTGYVEPFSERCCPVIGGGDRMGIQITTAAGVAPDCVVEVWGVE